MFKEQVLPAMDTAVGATLLALLVVCTIRPRFTVFAPSGSSDSQYWLAVPLMTPVLVLVLSQFSACTTSEYPTPWIERSHGTAMVPEPLLVISRLIDAAY